MLAATVGLVVARAWTLARDRREARASAAAACADGLLEETLAIPSVQLVAIAGDPSGSAGGGAKRSGALSIGAKRSGALAIEPVRGSPSMIRVRATCDGASAEMLRTNRVGP